MKENQVLFSRNRTYQANNKIREKKVVKFKEFEMFVMKELVKFRLPASAERGKKSNL